MNEIEARTTLAKHIRRYRSLSYAYLATAARLGRIDTEEIQIEGGGVYKIDVKVDWEEGPDESVKVTGLIRSAIGRAGGSPITEDFVIAPTGEFACE